MTFVQLFRLSNYSLILVGMGSLCLARFLHPVVLIVPVAAMVFMEYPPTLRVLSSISRHMVNAVSTIVFLCVIADYVMFGRDLIADVVVFTVYLQVLKILTARRNRDYFQIYTLALSHLILTTMLTIATVFLVPFLLFIVLAPWCLTLYTLKARMEDAYLGPEKLRLKQSADIQDERVVRVLRSRDVVGGRLFVVTAVLSLALLAHTLGIFFLFPRVSLGFMTRGSQHGDAVSGFSEQVDLSSFGEIKNSDALAMRVFPEPGVTYDSDLLYWRGLIFDLYDGSEWMRRHEKSKRSIVSRVTGVVRFAPRRDGGLIKQRIQLEHLDTDVVFATPRAEMIAWRPEQVEQVLQRGLSPSSFGPAIAVDAYGGMHFDGGMETERTYTTYSYVPRPSPVELRTMPRSADSGEIEVDAYLQLPEFSERFHSLARSLVADAGSDYDRVQSVMQHVMSQCDYTLDVPRQGSNPVESFLFEKPFGHCEYFASATALLLRAAGVPARLVSGFRGGDWNRYGNYISVRERHAHTWIEVYFPSYGWLSFDPTPPDASAGGFRAVRFEGLRHFYEWIELRWYNHIVNYTVEDQQRIAGGLLSHIRSMRAQVRSGEWIHRWRNALDRRRGGSRAGKPAGLLVAVAGGLIVVGALCVLAFRALPRKLGRKRGAIDRAPLFYRRFLSKVQRRGYRRQPGETPREFAVRIGGQLPEFAADIDFLISNYYLCRYGLGRLGDTESRRIAQTLQKLSKRAS
ncbi:MAG: DUF3488 and transglutaminase-like domain-containing protein [Verrucomicrobia bacterium]|nr:DUF3488 and transglutaminase-like domain-containing protein [Verrucomicrobiota bacterium]MDA1087488.1 DUF3488 and transglutaminase-like domain-containing protein [Verrucomicrobiota bacterium]